MTFIETAIAVFISVSLVETCKEIYKRYVSEKTHKTLDKIEKRFGVKNGRNKKTNNKNNRRNNNTNDTSIPDTRQN